MSNTIQQSKPTAVKPITSTSGAKLTPAVNNHSKPAKICYNKNELRELINLNYTKKFKNGLINVADYNDMSNETLDRYIKAKGDDKAREILEKHLNHIEKCYEQDKSTKRWNTAAAIFTISLFFILTILMMLMVYVIVEKTMINKELTYTILGFVGAEITAIGLYLGFERRKRNQET